MTSSEDSVNFYRTLMCQNIEDDNLHSHPREDFRCAGKDLNKTTVPSLVSEASSSGSYLVYFFTNLV